MTRAATRSLPSTKSWCKQRPQRVTYDAAFGPRRRFVALLTRRRMAVDAHAVKDHGVLAVADEHQPHALFQRIGERERRRAEQARPFGGREREELGLLLSACRGDAGRVLIAAAPVRFRAELH